jgi:hypothetical protein
MRTGNALVRQEKPSPPVDDHATRRQRAVGGDAAGGLVAVLDSATACGRDWPRLARAVELPAFGGGGALLGWRLLGERGDQPPDLV